MPYRVDSHCSACGHGDSFVIGLWQKYLGLYVCASCKSIVNIPLETGTCECGVRPALDHFYDYAYAIPDMQGRSMGNLEPGPNCPKCAGAEVTFETKSHFRQGRHSLSEDNERPWIGRDYPEKAVFVWAMMAVEEEFGLDHEELLEYYSIDVPISLITRQRISLPILIDIRNEMCAAAVSGAATFTVTPKLQQIAQARLGARDMLKVFQEIINPKPWWQFWK